MMFQIENDGFTDPGDFRQFNSGKPAYPSVIPDNVTNGLHFTVSAVKKDSFNPRMLRFYQKAVKIAVKTVIKR